MNTDATFLATCNKFYSEAAQHAAEAAAAAERSGEPIDIARAKWLAAEAEAAQLAGTTDSKAARRAARDAYAVYDAAARAARAA